MRSNFSRLIVFFCLFLTASAFALTVPEKPEAYVNDYARLLSQTERQKLEEKLAAFEKETSTQLVIAIFDSLEGSSLEDFSIRLADQWKIGGKKNDNGVILLIFKNDRQVRIEVGYGLEGALPDAVASQIIQNEIVPAFRAGDFDAGVGSAVDAIIQATRGEYTAARAAQEDKMKAYSPFIFMGLVFYFIFPILCYLGVMVAGVALFGFPAGAVIGFLVVLFLLFLRQVIFSSYLGQTFSGRSGGFWGGGGFGGGGFSGGGFGGGGGGGFGGGGASGRW